MHQTCKVCKTRDKFNFDVPDSIWKTVVPQKYQNKVVCLSCFDDFASKKNVDIRSAIENLLYFVGDSVVYEFELVDSYE